MEKLRLVYDATELRNGFCSDSGRSGLFSVALNVLRELVRRGDVDLTLTCKFSDYAYVKYVLNQEFHKVDFNFEIDCKAFVFYSQLKLMKRLAANNKESVKKVLLQLLCLVVSPICKLLSFFVKKNTFEEFDAFLSPVFSISKEIKARKYTILHDLIPLKFPEYRSNDWKMGFWLYDLCQSLNSNDCYFTVSENTRSDFLKCYPQINERKIKTILLGCAEYFRPMDSLRIKTVKEKYNIPLDKKYVFSLCTLDPRKNLERTVRTFVQFLQKNSIEDMVFVLGGGHWKSFIERLDSEIATLGEFKEKILKIGYVADEDLPALYSGAEWFCFTSAYEGFGLPPLEAMSCECPVITSNNSSLPEVIGNAGIMIDWDSDEQHIEAYEKYYFNPQLRKVNREKGLARAKEFSWKKCVDEMVRIMKHGGDVE